MMLVLGVVTLLAGSLSSAHAERRVALVIGNSSYRSMTALKNPRNDATDVATSLRDLGFEVMLRTDMERGAVRATLKDFSRMVSGADTALFYFAGHALEFRGQYFLAPIDVALEDGDALKYDMLSAEDVRELLDKATGMRLMIFDACRNDPLDPAGAFSPEAARTVRQDTLLRALDGAKGGQGMVVAYATAPLDVAEDGKARNSPFTRALLKWLMEPDLDVRPLFQHVSRDVHEQTRGRQVPEISLALSGPYILNQTESHNTVWLRIRQSSDPIDFRDFLARFPYSEHAPNATRRLAVLERAQRLAEQRRAEEERLRREEAERRASAERAEQVRQAEERRRTVCGEERDRINALRTLGPRDALERLKAASTCLEESGPLVDAALNELSEREAREQHAQAEAAACRQEGARVPQLAAAGRKDELAALDAGTRCMETHRLAREAIADIERRDEEERSRQRTTAARRAEAERQAQELLRRQEMCAEEARSIRDTASGDGARARLDALSGRLGCNENSGLLETNLRAATTREANMKEAAEREAVAKETSARETAEKDAAATAAAAKATAAKEAAAREAAVQATARATCTAEVAAFTALDPVDPAPLAAFARTARCPDVATAALAQMQHIVAERDRLEQSCAHDRIEFEHLRQMGSEGRLRLEQLGAATACEGLKPLVLAALGTSSLPNEPSPPAVNAPEQLRRASKALRHMGCFDGNADDGSLDSVRQAVRKYYTVRAMDPPPRDVDDAVVKQLEGEGRRRVCPLECPEGERVKGDRCVPSTASQPHQRERDAVKPAPQKPAPRPAQKPAASPKPAAAPPRPSPPVAAAPAPKRQPSIILGN